MAPGVERRFVPFDEALATVLGAARKAEMPVERIPLDDALGRTLREEIVADEPYPPYANSAMDGYAVRAEDTTTPTPATPATPVTLAVLETIGAGKVATQRVEPGTAIRIMTGAVMPEGADAIVPVEQTQGSPSSPAVQIHTAVSPGDHVRPQGEDFGIGERLVESGTVIDPFVIAVMAALGHAEADVSRPPRVAVLTTGNELVGPGKPLEKGQVRDSNVHMIRAQIRAAGALTGPCWHLADEPTAITDAVARVKDESDVIVSIGGVSAGDFDPVKQALIDLKGVELWRVGMRPGQPQAFGVLDDGTLFFGLPGNPVSAAVVFEMLVRPALWRIMGRRDLDRPTVRALLAEPVSSKVGRRDFLRVRLEALSPTESGGLSVPFRAWLTGTQSSGAVSSLQRSDGLAIVEAASGHLDVLAPVRVILTRPHSQI